MPALSPTLLVSGKQGNLAKAEIMREKKANDDVVSMTNIEETLLAPFVPSADSVNFEPISHPEKSQ